VCKDWTPRGQVNRRFWLQINENSLRTYLLLTCKISILLHDCYAVRLCDICQKNFGKNQLDLYTIVFLVWEKGIGFEFVIQMYFGHMKHPMCLN
jgi:hypothetical protein